MKIVNIIAVTDLKREINLNELPMVKYDAKKFSGAIFKTVFSTVLIFKNGKLVLTGIKNVSDIDPTVTKVRYLIKDYSANKNPSYLIKNIVAVSKFQSIRLPDMYKNFRNHFKNIFYEPELFPAIHIKSKSTCLALFASGKFISTGIANEAGIVKAHNQIGNLIQLYNV